MSYAFIIFHAFLRKINKSIQEVPFFQLELFQNVCAHPWRYLLHSTHSILSKIWYWVQRSEVYPQSFTSWPSLHSPHSVNLTSISVVAPMQPFHSFCPTPSKIWTLISGMGGKCNNKATKKPQPPASVAIVHLLRPREWSLSVVLSLAGLHYTRFIS